MVLEVELYLEQDTLPIDYRRFFMSIIKNVVKEYAGGAHYTELYSGTKMKDFTFAVLMYSPVFQQDKIYLENQNLKLKISSGNNKTVFILFSAFLNAKNKNKHIKWKQNSIVIKNAKTYQHQEIKENQALFKIISPICLRTHYRETNKDEYISIQHNEFVEKLKENIERNAPQEIKALINQAIIIPLECRKTVIKHYGQSIEATLGQLVIQAETIVLNYVNQYPVGSRGSAGFGYLQYFPFQRRNQ